MSGNGDKHNTASYARKRIAKLEARIDLADHSHPTLIIHGKPARERARLDRIVLKNWQAKLTKLQEA